MYIYIYIYFQKLHQSLPNVKSKDDMYIYDIYIYIHIYKDMYIYI